MQGLRPRLRPTRRGWAVAGVALLGVALGVTAGARSLNAVVVPALVGLLAGWVQLARADRPTVERSVVQPGFPGERRAVSVRVRSPIPCRITEAVDRSLTVHARSYRPTADVGHAGRLEYSIGLAERGCHRLGPATCRQTDSLGLFSRSVEADDGVDVVVYPELYDLADDVPFAVGDGRVERERATFDRLREFSPGDSLRDIHWRASAKRPPDELVVAEYTGHADAGHVHLVGEATVGGGDAMASAVASIATHLQDEGVSVTVSVPDGRVGASPGQRSELLRLLALTGEGRVDGADRAGADVVVGAERWPATVSVADREHSFEELTADRRGAEVPA